jgi:hypothetical protein
LFFFWYYSLLMGRPPHLVVSISLLFFLIEMFIIFWGTCRSPPVGFVCIRLRCARTPPSTMRAPAPTRRRRPPPLTWPSGAGVALLRRGIGHSEEP